MNLRTRKCESYFGNEDVLRLLHSRNASHDVLEYTIRDVTYPQGGTFSRYELKLALTRPAVRSISPTRNDVFMIFVRDPYVSLQLSGFVKDILPPLFICLVQFFSFSINPENVVIRISMMGAGKLRIFSIMSIFTLQKPLLAIQV